MAKGGPKPPPSPSEPYQGLLSGSQWPVDTILTYSFPDLASDYGRGYSEAKKFEAFDEFERAAFTTVITQVESFTTLQFELLMGSSDGTAQIRIGKTVTPGADAWAYYPGSGKGGDAWFDKGLDGSFGGKGGMNWDAIKPGDYTYTVFMHEFGHSLGLKHSFESGGLAGAVPKQYDSLEYTVMSYDAYQTDPYDSSVDQRNWWADDGNNPQTFMMLDIAALQTMYGADYTYNSTNTRYVWDADGRLSLNGAAAIDLNDSTNVIFMTVWDGGGNDTYDFSAYSAGVSIDLNPGKWVTIDYANSSDPLQRADLLAGTGTYWATGNIANALLFEGDARSLIENAVGGSGDDILIGNQAQNILVGGAGLDTLSGGAEADLFVFNSGLDTYDVLVDFAPVDDTIWIDTDVFSAFKKQGTISEDEFWLGTTAHDQDDHILYDPTTGYLYYDADALGGAAAVHFATLTSRPTDITYEDFTFGSDLLVA